MFLLKVEDRYWSKEPDMFLTPGIGNKVFRIKSEDYIKLVQADNTEIKTRIVYLTPERIEGCN